ncbi:MAG: bifunctional (p)ppGpp synthetase/guanosine-3',5'-bis(diphosphate) 3'-pyrophosphohydrolase [Hyphomonadaceae bacterium]|nr:bifunctional (p)ppGpp synthetase/guanosine-3',5'-bis(diphosphate) 3'-pyrophosphohydrolase [Hyphomonadaceae bacterium]
MAATGASTAKRVEDAPGGMRASSVEHLTREQLVARVAAYHPGLDEERLGDAYDFARTHHGEQLRASGDPYYSHPVFVSELLVQLRLDQDTIIAGLLHDVVEDTEISLEDVRTRFGENVADLVNGVTKLTQLEYNSEETKQAENFQKFILATINDIRVLLVKLADRMHNMRTIHHLKKQEKRQRIARETMEIYAPLARRIGLYHVASELEDRSFQQLNPEAREAMTLRLQQLEAENKIDLERIREDIHALMDAANVKCRIKGRRKTPYSIWRKLERKQISFRDVADIFAFRIIVDGDAAECYRVLGVLHTVWSCLPERFRDFVSVPKPNGYQSLHTTVRASGNRRVEFQIRTEEMDHSAEYGVAAHWTYKNLQYGLDLDAARKAGLDPEANLRAFSELFQHEHDPSEFLEHAKLEMYRENVFTFTPKGRLIRLPAGAMPLDFAYEVHTAIGNTCVGARINGEPRSLRTVLNNGDVVEIIRGREPKAPNGWTALTVTGKAKAALRRLARDKEANDFRRLGYDLIRKALRRADIDPVGVRMDHIALRAGFTSSDEMTAAIGRSEYSTKELIQVIFPGYEPESSVDRSKLRLDDDHASEMVSGEALTPGVTLHLGQCCYPIPGERIIGIREPGQGIVVHSISCDRVAEYDDQPERWVDLQWTELAKTGAVAVARIRVTAANHRGVLATLCTAVAQANGNILTVNTGRRHEDYTDLLFDIEVEDMKRVTQILAALRSLAVVDTAVREQESRHED